MSDNGKKKKVPSVKIPFLFRFIQFIFPWLERIAPPLANRLTVLVFFSPMRFKMPEKEKVVFQNAEKFELDINKRKIQIYKWGEGPAVLMTHGWSGRGTQFRKFIRPFNEVGYSVVAFDGPAHGRSQGGRTNIIEFSQVIRKLENKFGPLAGTIGHSFGGVSILYAASMGIRVNKIILIATPTIADEIISESLKRVNASSKRGDYLQKYILKKFGSSFEDASALKLVEKIKKTPILVIHDHNDKEVPVNHADILQKKYPFIRLVKTKGLGHNRILKNMEVIQNCLEFVSDSQILTSTAKPE